MKKYFDISTGYASLDMLIFDKLIIVVTSEVFDFKKEIVLPFKRIFKKRIEVPFDIQYKVQFFGENKFAKILLQEHIIIKTIV